jgi:nicotinate-nucleotide adenylyltransferase
VARIGVLGGTFDPIHVGHLVAASEVHHALGLDTVLLVPANAQPLKPAPTASGSERLAMCEAVAATDPRLGVSDVDVARGGATYTVDTLADLRKGNPGAEFFFITGADALATLPRWKDYETLITLATFVGVTRPGHSLNQSDAPHVLVDVPGMAVSSTEVRDRVRAGAPIRYLVPDAVARHIELHSLYLGGNA